MAQKRQDNSKKPALIGLFQTLLLFLLLGAAGALLGTRLIMLMNGGASPQGIKVGAVLLIISACLAAPAAFLLQRIGGRSGHWEARATRGGGQD